MLARTGRLVASALGSPPRRRPDARARPSSPESGPTPRVTGAGYPGDYHGPLTAEYDPALDGNADPGEIVWTWVPFEEDPTQGKDRPVVIVGRDGSWLLGLMLTSKDHSRNYELEALRGRSWMDIGTGDWDRQRRDSEVRLDRVIRVEPTTVRREGAIMAPELFHRIVARLRP